MNKKKKSSETLRRISCHVLEPCGLIFWRLGSYLIITSFRDLKILAKFKSHSKKVPWKFKTPNLVTCVKTFFRVLFQFKSLFVIIWLILLDYMISSFCQLLVAFLIRYG